MTPSAALEAVCVRMCGVAACVARWRVMAGVCVRLRGVAGVRGLLARGWRRCGSVRVCRVGAWRHMLETAGVRSQESRRANAVRPILRLTVSVGLQI